MSLVASSGILNIGGVICNPDGTIKQKLTLSASVLDTSRRPFTPLPCVLMHDNDARSAMADVVVDLFDAGTTNAEGRIRLYTAGGITLLATILMSNPSFDTAINGVAAGLSLPWSDPFASGSGTAAEFAILDRNESIILTGDVAESGEDMSFPQLEIAVNDIVKLLSVSYTAPP